ncbi:hypothetical protein F5144DRAFT_177257 [Chaetomium tenue]|uniref:Uncharacterized protein n=1 Tax=Chaetomium tenue TaxID=1854479 RepID=A0ACB7PGA1_9PEZI|nr:hypothetical protein F5144DRAFT_177257 [Chaetomium globosum]
MESSVLTGLEGVQGHSPWPSSRRRDSSARVDVRQVSQRLVQNPCLAALNLAPSSSELSLKAVVTLLDISSRVAPSWALSSFVAWGTSTSHFSLLPFATSHRVSEKLNHRSCASSILCLYLAVCERNWPLYVRPPPSRRTRNFATDQPSACGRLPRSFARPRRYIPAGLSFHSLPAVPLGALRQTRHRHDRNHRHALNLDHRKSSERASETTSSHL